MAVGRDPETIGELWQFIQGELNLVRSQMKANDKVAVAAITLLIESVKSQDKRLDANDAIVQQYILSIPEKVKGLEINVRALQDNQRTVIAGGSVLFVIVGILWPIVKSWLHIP